jgi:hypothetical protein
MNLTAFIDRWLKSGSSERANKDSFLKELCQVLDLPEPDPKRGDPAKDRYVFERDVRVQAPDGKVTTKFMDLYKEGCFVLEAKQTAEKAAPKKPGAKVSTEGWENSMQRACTQAMRYAENIAAPPPFLIVCDIAHCFDVYAGFDGTARYTPFPIPEKKRLPFADLAQHADLLRMIWTDPFKLDPARHAKKVSEDVAGLLAEVATDLEKSGNKAEYVAEFLMRCLFTMFAEDVGLLEENLFTNALKTRWIPKPELFPAAIENLWQAMNAGTIFGMDKLLRFNGGLFHNAGALRLTEGQLKKLLTAAERDWSKVEPAIFGTLLEQALNPKERHKLGAHYTPRAYVERLVRPTVEEPVRDEWNVVRAEVFRFRELEKPEDAKEALRKFHTRLTEIRVLDPACGTGNFLYVTLDILKQIESEVLAELRALGEKQQLLDISRVSPAQLFGIEVNPRAKAIAELVLWLGHLQWHYKTHGRLQPPPEPVLQDLRNIECRDAVLVWDKIELIRDGNGKPITRWDGETMKKSPVTGEMVPDDAARVTDEIYINPRKASWPKADFVVGNPPFIGAKRIRGALGDGYAAALRVAHTDVPDSVDLVMYWWNAAANIVSQRELRRAGFITTNSITSLFNRRVPAAWLGRASAPTSIVFAIPDHPWIDATNGAAVRIAMTVIAPGVQPGKVDDVVSESHEGTTDGSAAISVRSSRGRIDEVLRVRASPSTCIALRSNTGLASMGVQLYGSGFLVDAETAHNLGQAINKYTDRSTVRPFLSGRDFAARSRDLHVIDFFGMAEDEARAVNPSAFQVVLDHVKPERDVNRRDQIRVTWWRHGWERLSWRAAARPLPRYILTGRTAKHRVFRFVDSSVLPESELIAIAIDDACLLGILSSRIHTVWSLAAGTRLGVGNDPRYNHSACFDKFPFPVTSGPVRIRIEGLAESIDSHRKACQAAHADLTITGIYNILEKLRSGAELTEKDKLIHQQGLVSVLKQIHDDLDAAVFDAYGWPRDLTDEQILEKLVALNAERAEEERNGHIRWLRPDFQNPSGAKKPENLTLAGTDAPDETDDDKPAPTATAAAWPKRPGERIAAIRDLVVASKRLWQTAEVAAAFKGSKKKDVADLLDSLAGIGVLAAYGETEKDLRWGVPTRVSAA